VAVAASPRKESSCNGGAVAVCIAAILVEAVTAVGIGL